MSSVSNGLYFLTLPLVSVMRVIYRKMSCALSIHQKECRKSLGCALSIEKYGSFLFMILCPLPLVPFLLYPVFSPQFLDLCLRSYTFCHCFVLFSFLFVFSLFSLSLSIMSSSQILARLTFPCGFTRSAQNFEMYRRHFKIQGTKRATLSRFHSEDPQMLGTNAKSIDAVATCRPRFVHPWFYYRLFLSWQFVFNYSFIPVMYEHTFLSLYLFSLSVVTFKVTCLLFLYFLSCIFYVPIFSPYILVLSYCVFFHTFLHINAFRILFCNFVSLFPYFSSR